jgi:hypothetical protein
MQARGAPACAARLVRRFRGDMQETDFRVGESPP